MIHILVGCASELPPGLDTTLAQYRYKVFVERLGWQLPVEAAAVGYERDQFDRSDTIYVVARDIEGHICGCARLLPTTNSYLLGEVFPHLLAGGAIFAAPDIWELSRFAAVSYTQDGDENAEAATSSARALLAAAVAYAAQHGVQRLIGITYLSMERWFRRMGVHMHRAGPPVLIDGEPVVACWIEIDDQTLQALGIETEAQFPHSPASRWSQ